MMTHRQNLRRSYPEIEAGGFSRVDGTIEFYTRVNALINPSTTVLDIGAGRGVQLLETRPRYRATLATLKGRVRRLVGVDVDRSVLDNRFLDEAHVIDAGGALPFPDDTFDLVYADWVLEHVAAPEAFASEVRRVLKPGGWFCARTPNRWGVTGLGTNLLPNALHAKLLQFLQPDREAQDVFPTAYRLNSRRRLQRYFNPEAWEDYSYFHNAEPPYVQRSRLLMALANFYFRLVPEALATNFHVFIRKR